MGRSRTTTMKSNRNGPLSQVKGADVFWAIGGLFTQTEESREPAMRRRTGDVMDFGHLVRPARSASKVCVGIAGVPLWVPLKICVFSSGGWSASTRLFRPSATRTSGRSLQGRGCIFCICQGCLVSVGM